MFDSVHVLRSSIVPSGGRRQPLKLSGMAQAKAYAYIFAMATFDRFTPTLLGLNASLIVLFLTSVMVLMTCSQLARAARGVRRCLQRPTKL